jgi:hypothetical protein
MDADGEGERRESMWVCECVGGGRSELHETLEFPLLWQILIMHGADLTGMERVNPEEAHGVSRRVTTLTLRKRRGKRRPYGETAYERQFPTEGRRAEWSEYRPHA